MIGTVLGVGATALGIWRMTIVFGAVDQLGKDLQNLGNDPAAMGDVTVSGCSVDNDPPFANTHGVVTMTMKRPQAGTGVHDRSRIPAATRPAR